MPHCCRHHHHCCHHHRCRLHHHQHHHAKPLTPSTRIVMLALATSVNASCLPIWHYYSDNELRVLISTVCHHPSPSLLMSCVSHPVSRGSRFFSFPRCPLWLALSLHFSFHSHPLPNFLPVVLSWHVFICQRANVSALFLLSASVALIQWDWEWKCVTILACESFQHFCRHPFFQTRNCSICYQSGLRAPADPGHQIWDWLTCSLPHRIP